LGARAETFARSLYAGTPRAELFGLCDIDADRTTKFCAYCELKNARTFTDPEAFVADPGMDALIVTTPDFTHLDMAKIALRAGRHVYLEKPLEVTAERCREIIRLHRPSGVTAFVGFNMRAMDVMAKAREIVQSGILGRIVGLEGGETLWWAHIAAFMRRFHRYNKRSGGLLNTKACHDLDLIQWIVGHEHRVTRIASFGGTSVFRPENAPVGHGETCHECPPAIAQKCPYIDRAGFVFPVRGTVPIHKTQDTALYGGDLCAYTADKDIVDNQSVLLEWDHGVRGTFNLQGFQHQGNRYLKVWGEQGLLHVDHNAHILRVTRTSGETIDYSFAQRAGGHGGTDPQMLGRFLDAIERGGVSDSGLEAGLAATLVAEKALIALQTGRILEIAPSEYEA
jgi:predicted dehydrogenase